MKPIILAALGLCLLTATAARADVKAGVDAWNQGDYARAVNEWRPLAIGGNADAQFNLGQAYKLGRGVPVDLPVALEWFRKASEQGHEKSVDNYGLLLFQQGRREDAMPYVKVSADRGEPRAQYVYATALFNGDLATRDWVRAYALMTRAAQAGVTQAAASLAQMDQHIPEEQRREGLTLATAMAQGKAPALTPALAQAAPTSRTLVAAPIASATPARTRPTPPGPDVPIVAPSNGPEARPPVRKMNGSPVIAASQASTAAPPAKPAAATSAPAPKPAGAGRYRVQLGAFREQGRAPALWKSLNGKVSGLSAFQPSYVASNGLTRLLVGPLATSADAQRLCARITPTGTPCVVQAM